MTKPFWDWRPEKPPFCALVQTLLGSKDLSANERKFLRSIMGYRTLTPAQQSWLERITKRIGRDRRPQPRRNEILDLDDEIPF